MLIHLRKIVLDKSAAWDYDDVTSELGSNKASQVFEITWAIETTNGPARQLRLFIYHLIHDAAIRLLIVLGAMNGSLYLSLLQSPSTCVWSSDFFDVPLFGCGSMKISAYVFQSKYLSLTHILSIITFLFANRARIRD